ncbi:MAG: glutamate racemase [Endozoicomonas sp. (ex Botrylloides leachii)]|nr:glutamate racemase [Endozoicomonas sp. (ex Botrylloides leachii)]
MPPPDNPILIFDSGIGGLSIYRKIMQMLPDISVVYCADNAGFPYGLQKEADVINRTRHYLTMLTKRYRPALAVVACNTASTIVLPSVRQALNIPIVGVVPAIKTAGKLSRNRCIGLLATLSTVNRYYTDQLIQRFANDCEIIRVGSNELVYMAEHYVRDRVVDKHVLKEILSPFFRGNTSPDTIVLGCTHFPLLKHLLRTTLPSCLNWIDSGEAIARRVRSLLHSGAAEKPAMNVCNRFVYTGSSIEIDKLSPTLKAEGFQEIYLL